MNTSQEILTLKGHSGPVRCVAVSPDGKRIVSGSEDNTVKVWDATTGQETLTLKVKGRTDSVFSVVLSPDGKRLVSGGKDTTVRVWDASRSEPSRRPWRSPGYPAHTGWRRLLSLPPQTGRPGPERAGESVVLSPRYPFDREGLSDAW